MSARPPHDPRVRIVARRRTRAELRRHRACWGLLGLACLWFWWIAFRVFQAWLAGRFPG